MGCIDAAPLQLYQSALAIAPVVSSVRQTYGSGLEDSVVVCRGALYDWGPCLDVFQGHGGRAVYCVAFSPDGTCFATGGQSDEITIRRSTTKTVLLSIDAHHGDVNSVVFSPDGSHLACGFADRTVGVWRVISEDHVMALVGHTSEVYSVIYSKDGTRILSNSDHEAILWDTSDGRPLLTLSMPDAGTWQAALSPNGGVIAHGSVSGLCLYNVASATRDSLPLPGPAHAAAFSLDGQYISAAADTSICIWSTANKTLVRSINVPSFPFRLAFSHDGTRICCGLKNGSVCVWQVESNAPPQVFRRHTDWVYDIAWSPDDTQIASVSGDSNVRVCDPSRGPDSDVQRRSSEPILPSPTSPPSTLLYQGNGIDIIPIRNPFNTEDFQTPVGAPSPSFHLDVPDAWDAAFTTMQRDRELNLIRCMRSRDWELLTGQRHIQVNWVPSAISRDSSQIAYLPERVKNEVHVYNLRTGGVASRIAEHAGSVRSAAFSSDGTLLVTGAKDTAVKVWNIANAALVASHVGHTHWVYDTVFSSDDRLVVSGSSDSTALVYDIATACITHTLQHPTTVTKVAFSSNNTHVLTLDSQRNVAIWDLSQTARVLRASLAGNTWPRSLDFTPEGADIIIRDNDGRILSTFAMHGSSERTWPAYHVSDDGWVTAIWPGQAHRVCWLRPEWRAVFPLGGARFCALDMDRKVSVVIDVSQTPAFLEFSRSGTL